MSIPLDQASPRNSPFLPQLFPTRKYLGHTWACASTFSFSAFLFSGSHSVSLLSHTHTHTYTHPHTQTFSLSLLLSGVERNLRDLINYLLFLVLLPTPEPPALSWSRGLPIAAWPHAFPQHCLHSSPQQLPYSPSPPSPLRWLPALEPERLGRAGWGRGRGVVGAEPSAGAGPSAQSSPPYPWQHLHSISVTVL